MSRMNPAAMRFTCSPIRVRAASGSSRRRRHRARLESQWAGAVLPQRQPDAGRGHCHTARVCGQTPRTLEGPYLSTPGTFPNYDVTPDGQRFLMLKRSEQEQTATHINVVLNWLEELKRRVPTGNHNFS